MHLMPFGVEQFKGVNRPDSDSHKAQNGRVLVIGGSQLFHASIFWTADICSRFVDLVHFSSPANENNELVRGQIKSKFWDGIVVDWSEIESYIQEDDTIVIGPGMPRPDGLLEGEKPTAEIVNQFLATYPDKRWVVDGGALQEVNPELLNQNMIITPHLGEWDRLLGKLSHLFDPNPDLENTQIEELVHKMTQVSKALNDVTILLKGFQQIDLVVSPNAHWIIEGGNEGLTKGGSGDVLAGLAASFYVMNPADTSAAAASFLIKSAADDLYPQVGPRYNTSELVKQIPVSANQRFQ